MEMSSVWEFWALSLAGNYADMHALLCGLNPNQVIYECVSQNLVWC